MLRARLRSSESLICIAALGAVLGSLTQLDVPSTRIFFAFALLVAASEMFEVTLPNGITYSLGIAPGLGFILLGRHSISEALVVLATGIAMATVVRAVSREPLRLVDSASHVLALAAAAGVFEAVQHFPGLAVFDRGDASPITAGDFGGLLLTPVAILAAVLLVDSSLRAIRRAERDRVPIMPILIGSVRATVGLHLSLISVGALLALSYHTLQDWAFPLFLAPLAATQYAYKQFASIKKTYLQTIRALSKVPEMAGYSADGHSRRVAELSVAIARDLGAPDHVITEIEYAALLHDIGRVSLAEPEDAAAADPRELATVGATIVRETGHFPQVADMIAGQALAYRRRGEDTDESISLGARAIKVASAYDDWTNPGGIGLAPRDALERLYRDMTYEFDPDVIKALIRVLEKRSEI